MKRLRSISTAHALPLLPLLLLLLVALLAPVLSNNKAILIWTSGGIHVPVAGDMVPEEEKVIFAIHPPVPYSPTDIDLQHVSQPPLTLPLNQPWYYMHWLGTDEIGRDVLAHLIYGCRTSVWIAFGAMIIALTAGLLLGAISGYWHRRQLKMNYITLLLALLMAGFLINFGSTISISYHWFFGFLLSATLFALFIFLLIRLNHTLLSQNFHSKFSFHFSPDAIIVGAINFFTAIPAYFALLALLALWSNPSSSSLAVILGLLMWPDIARLTRSAVIKNRGSGWAESAQSLGYSPIRITLFHLLPNALQPALAALSFGIGGAIMAESFLSFVGIAPAEMVSWGTLLAKIRSYPEMWWLSVFPGLAMLFAILTFYRIAEHFGTSRKY